MNRDETNAYHKGIFDTVIQWVEMRQQGKHTREIIQDIFKSHGMNVTMIFESVSDAYSPYESDTSDCPQYESTIVQSLSSSVSDNGSDDQYQCPASPSYLIRDTEEERVPIPRPPSEVFKNTT